MESNILIKIIKEAIINEKKIESEEYITDLYIYTKTSDSQILYRKDTNKLYKLNKEQYKLDEILENNEQIAQIKQLKSMIKFMDISKTEFDEKKKYMIEAKSDIFTLNAEIITTTIEELKQTVNYESYKKSQETSFFDLDLPPNELIENTDILINIQGKKTVTSSAIKSIDMITNDINRYDYLYNYQY